MADKIMPLSEAVEGYELFDKMKVQKGKRFAGSKSSRQIADTPSSTLVVFEAQK